MNGKQIATETLSMRPLDCVLDAIMNVVPEEDIIYRDLCEDLTRIKSSYRYAAPEMVSHWWDETSASLQYYIPSFDQDWKRKVAEIFTAKLDFRMFLRAKDTHESET